MPMLPIVPLEADMVLTLEPGQWMVHEENIVIRLDGAQCLSTRASPEMPVIDGAL